MTEFTTCPQCGIFYGVPDHWLQAKRETRDTFYCPNGHGASFKETTADKLAKQLSAERQRAARLEDEARAASQRAERAEKATKRLQKRASAGTCPCCQRTFSNMATHMRKEHPQFVAGRVSLKAVK